MGSTILVRGAQTDASNINLDVSLGTNQDLTTWTEVDSGAQVTVAANLLTAVGTGAWNVNGIISPVKNFTEGTNDFIEFEVQASSIANFQAMLGPTESSTLTLTGSDLGAVFVYGDGTGNWRIFPDGGAASDTTLDWDASTWYTLRMYWANTGIVVLINGGAFTWDHLLLASPTGNFAAAAESTLYVQFQVHTGTLSIRNVKFGTFNVTPAAGGGTTTTPIGWGNS